MNLPVLSRLGLSHLVSTRAMKPALHGYFISLKLYDAARVIANPFEYEQYREQLINKKREKLAETRIRAQKGAAAGGKAAGKDLVKVNQKLAERVQKEEESRAKRKEKERLRKLAKATAGDEMEVDEEVGGEGEGEGKPAKGQSKKSVLTDPRFSAIFNDPAYEVDEESREWALLNPSAAFQRKTGVPLSRKVAQNDSDDEGSGSGSGSAGEDEEEQGSGGEDSSDSDEAGGGFFVTYRIPDCSLTVFLCSQSLFDSIGALTLAKRMSTQMWHTRNKSKRIGWLLQDRKTDE